MSSLRKLGSLPGKVVRALARPRWAKREVVRRTVYFQAPRVASWFRKRWTLLKNRHADISFGKGVYLGPGFSIHAPYGGRFAAGDYVEFRRGFRAELGSKARLEIGSYSYLTYDVIISCNTTISIGQRCGLGQGAYVVDGSHRFRDINVPFREQGYDYRAITIEDDVQVHSKCTIVNSIGKRAIIGANAVVTKPIPPYCVAGGVPARVLDYYGPAGQGPGDHHRRVPSADD
jgi:acetyltransferase-like isoleucine patch superfamily enzyme